MIGNGDMHLKNWTLLYADGQTPSLAPAYDFVSTVPYIPDDALALTLSRTKDMKTIGEIHFVKLAERAGVPVPLTKQTVQETVQIIRDSWHRQTFEHALSKALWKRINRHMQSTLLFKEC